MIETFELINLMYPLDLVVFYDNFTYSIENALARDEHFYV